MKTIKELIDEIQKKLDTNKEAFARYELLELLQFTQNIVNSQIIKRPYKNQKQKDKELVLAYQKGIIDERKDVLGLFDEIIECL